MVSRGSFHPLLTTIYSIIYQLSRVLSVMRFVPSVISNFQVILSVHISPKYVQFKD